SCNIRSPRLAAGGHRRGGPQPPPPGGGPHAPCCPPQPCGGDGFGRQPGGGGGGGDQPGGGGRSQAAVNASGCPIARARAAISVARRSSCHCRACAPTVPRRIRARRKASSVTAVWYSVTARAARL